MRNLFALMILLVLPACAGGGFIPAPSNAPVFQGAGNARAAPAPNPAVRQNVGPADLIGLTAGALKSRFGQARIDLAEGDARKLQFAGRSCVLDIYLYPGQRGVQPVSSHVAARLKDSGNAVDPGSCAAEIGRR
ncbi:hypothetical protein [Erythrobacter sp. MTPC3]|uniref:hypothetical protein n=1 Tax=Erythrobacter sp. MTPC3 TaxID=3056564 RepID=UPI0036F3FBF3